MFTRAIFRVSRGGDMIWVVSRGETLCDVLESPNNLFYSSKDNEEICKFYTASVLLALNDIHEKKIALRNLMAENLAFDFYGYINIVNFSHVKMIDDKNAIGGVGKTYTLCGDVEYQAPEVILNIGHDWCKFSFFKCYSLFVNTYKIL